MLPGSKRIGALRGGPTPGETDVHELRHKPAVHQWIRDEPADPHRAGTIPRGYARSARASIPAASWQAVGDFGCVWETGGESRGFFGPDAPAGGTGKGKGGADRRRKNLRTADRSAAVSERRDYGREIESGRRANPRARV